MPATLPHRIRRLHWQARAPTADTAFALRAQLRALSGAALDVLEKSLSGHVPDDRVIHLPRLELHLRLNPPLSADALLACIAAAADEALCSLAADTAGNATPRLLDAPRARLNAAPGEAQATRLAIDDALALDTLLREAPATLHAAITTALSRATRRPDEAIGQGDEAPVVVEINGQTLRLPARHLRELARQLAHRRAANPASPLSANTPAPPATRSAAADATPPTRAALPPGQRPPPRLAPHAPDLPRPASSTASAANAQAQLATYLQSGSLDWTLAGLESDAVLPILRAAAMVWARLGALPACVFPLPLIARPGALARWLALLPQASRQAVIECHQAAISHRRDTFSTALRKHLAGLTTASSEAIHAQALWLAWRMEPEHATDEAGAVWQQAMHAWTETLLAGGASPDPWTAVLASLHAPAERAGQAHPETGAIPHAGKASGKRTDAPCNTPADILQPTGNTTPRPGDFSVRHAPAAPAGLVVPAAGLVLLHPYLPRLLDATGLYPAGSKGPIADPALPRAAALLHWLASGRDVVHEFELPFIKLLLGRAPDAPLPHAPPALHDSERDEAGALLEAVLTHWQALRGTSTDGLRTGFLQRRGWIDKRDDAWLLRVEPESFDMLLGLLPWGLGLVRLPWMTQPLFTEWSAP